MRIRPRHWFPFLLLLGLTGLAYRHLLIGEAVPSVAAVRQALTETVISSGRIITPTRVELGAELVGSLAEVAVQEGDRVRAGQILARLDDGEQRALLEQAGRALEEAEARQQQLVQVARPVADQGLAQAEANLALAESEFERVRRLAEAGFYNRSRLDESRRALEAATAARQAALAQARGNRPEGVETRLAAARLAQARAAVDLARARFDNTQIRAPAAGVVVRKQAESGDVVTQGRKLFELAVDGETQVVLQVDEKNLGRLAVAQTAQVVADAYPGRPFAAEIFHIAPAVDAQKGSVEVKLRVPQPPAFARPDMTVSVEIRVGHKADAVTLASGAVRDAAGPQPWLLVDENGRAGRRPVRLGMVGSGIVEVTEGLRPGERVILPASGVREGQRVRTGS